MPLLTNYECEDQCYSAGETANGNQEVLLCDNSESGGTNDSSPNDDVKISNAVSQMTGWIIKWYLGDLMFLFSFNWQLLAIERSLQPNKAKKLWVWTLLSDHGDTRYHTRMAKSVKTFPCKTNTCHIIITEHQLSSCYMHNSDLISDLNRTVRRDICITHSWRALHTLSRHAQRQKKSIVIIWNCRLAICMPKSMSDFTSCWTHFGVRRNRFSECTSNLKKKQRGYGETIEKYHAKRKVGAKTRGNILTLRIPKPRKMGLVEGCETQRKLR